MKKKPALRRLPERSVSMKNGLRKRGEGGFTMVEVMVSAALLGILCMGLVGAFSSNFKAVSKSKSLVDGAAFLSTVMDSLEGQDFDALLAMNGNTFYDQSTLKDSRFRVDLTVSNVAVGFLMIRAVLWDLRANHELTRIVTYRSRR